MTTADSVIAFSSAAGRVLLLVTLVQRGCLPLSHVGSQNKMVLAVYFSTRPVHQQTEQSLLKLLMIYFTLHSPCSVVILTSGGLCSVQIQIEIRRCMGRADLCDSDTDSPW